VFLTECQEFENLLSLDPPTEVMRMVSKAREIRETFVLDSSISSVNLSAKNRRNLLDLNEDNLAMITDSKQLSVDSLTKAKEEVLLLLARDSFKRSQFTQEYAQADV
jgi:hypothetical protein